MKRKKYNRKGFTKKELITLIIMIILFYFGYKGGIGLIPWKSEFYALLSITVGIVSGCLSVLIFVFLCMGLGMFLQNRKKRGANKNS